jgi:hypothetical protein
LIWVKKTFDVLYRYLIPFFFFSVSPLCFLALSDGWWLFPIAERGIPDFFDQSTFSCPRWRWRWAFSIGHWPPLACMTSLSFYYYLLLFSCWSLWREEGVRA